MSGRDLSDEDKRAWRAATRHVRPISGRRGLQAPVIPVSYRFGRPSIAPLSRPDSPAGAPKNGPQNRQNEKSVRRGKQVVSASLDLHGHTQDSAWRALPQFLANEQARGSKCVIIITGKGKLGEGVLRRNFLHWLDMPEARALVTGYAPAHARHGGGGAWYVFLKKR